MCYNLNINFVYRGFDFTEQIISIDRMENAVALFGSFDENIKLIEKEFTVKVVSRDSELKIDGEAENVSKAGKVIDSLFSLSTEEKRFPSRMYAIVFRSSTKEAKIRLNSLRATVFVLLQKVNRLNLKP